MMGPGMGMMMGPGMMGGYGHGFIDGLDLSESQREQIADIQQDVIDNMWTHMRAMHQQMPAMWKARQGEKIDVDAVMKAHEAMMEAGRAMMRQRLEAHNAMLDVLTEEQREQLREGVSRNRRGGYAE
jgi:Spy/CpxP family protein refolding chaperone